VRGISSFIFSTWTARPSARWRCTSIASASPLVVDEDLHLDQIAAL